MSTLPERELRWLRAAAEGPHAARRFDAMVARRLAGEPLQYVLGEWSFRGLDLLVDPRVLIPRPETEWLVELALREPVPAGSVVADLGTGSGAIALALAKERPDLTVWATDASRDALAVAAANVAGHAAANVHLAHGDWFDALPRELAGGLALVVANPPYVAEHEVAALPAEVRHHEPRLALVSGPTGMEAVEVVVAGARRWLAPGGALVLEIAEARAETGRALASSHGYAQVEVHADLTGRPRVLVARVGSP